LKVALKASPRDVSLSILVQIAHPEWWAFLNEWANHVADPKNEFVYEDFILDKYASCGRDGADTEFYMSMYMELEQPKAIDRVTGRDFILNWWQDNLVMIAACSDNSAIKLALEKYKPLPGWPTGWKKSGHDTTESVVSD